jgi:transposase
MVDIQELLFQMRDHASNRKVARMMGMHRTTVKQYRQWATEQGLLTGPLPTLDDLKQRLDATMPQHAPPQTVSSVEPFREVVVQLRSQGVEIAALYQRLCERGFTGSYSAVYRFVRSIEPTTPDACVPVERQPGEEAQVDFGYAGMMWDSRTGTLRRTWLFVMTLAWSRYQFVAFVFDQSVATWLDLHRRAFTFFQGVVQYVVIDNLKAGITRACFENPQVQHAYRECAQHYGFRIRPCRPRTPEHKGKVEQGGVHYVKRNFLGGRAPTSLEQANEAVLEWCRTTAGLRCHGTTREAPRTRFEEVEQATLQPMPQTPYDQGIWKTAKVHRDCHLVFDNAFYSVPFRLVGEHVRVRGGLQTVRIYTMAYDLVATHTRAAAPGQRQTHTDHLPPRKVPGLTRTRESAQAEAEAIGPATAQVVATLLADAVVDRLPALGRLFALGERYGAERLEAACARAEAYDAVSIPTIRRILQQGLDQAPDAPGAASDGDSHSGGAPAESEPSATTFARSATDVLGAWLEGVRWN